MNVQFNESLSNSTRTIDYTQEMLKTASQIFWDVVVITLYLMVVFYIFVMLTIERKANGQRSNRNNRPTTAQKIGKLLRINRYTTTIIFIIQSFICLAERLVFELYFPNLCFLVKWAKVSLSNMIMMCSYTALWLRQRSIYANQALNHLTNRVTRFISAMIFFLIVLSAIGNMVAYIGNYRIAMTASGCSIVGARLSAKLSWIVIGATTLFMQISLLWLFLQPICKHRGNVGDTASSYNPVFKRAFATSFVCVLTDTIALSLSASSVINDALTITRSLQFSLFINVLMVIASFPDWKKTMFPYCSASNSEAKTETDNA
uniref:uncharacterized protein LOC120345013 n=1 Tax=Styela clava TaxID=7725 RepID=UPI00193A95EE|nr:uncharacterized protein LOC120345013 [Styela clava]